LLAPFFVTGRAWNIGRLADVEPGETPGACSEIVMSKVAELLERKQRLLGRLREQPNSTQLLEIERGLKEIDEALNRIESEEHDDAPDTPHKPPYAA